MRHLLTIAFVLACSARAAGQTVDSTLHSPAMPDSAAIRSTADSTARPANSSIDTVVTYTAKDSISYSVRSRFMNMYGKCETQFRTVGLKAERVDLNWDTSTLVAYGVPDTTRRDTTLGRPILKDGGEDYHGERVSYNFRTRKGRITVGTTEMQNGYYVGEKIKKVETDVLYVADGRYTTCDLPHPHFYFGSPRMKVYVRDQVVAEPVYFYIADVPVFALPFGVFPSRGGRASGIIAPAYGSDQRLGQYFSHFGYYWAISDYLDVSTAFDYYARGGWLNESSLRYKLRYNFEGSLFARVADRHVGDSGDPDYSETRDYRVALTHHQTLTPSSRLDVDFTFASANYFKNYSTNLNEILQQNIISNATYSKTWETSNRYLTVNISRDQSLTTGEIREGLPSISFTQSQVYPFRKKSASRGLTGTSTDQMSFLDMLGFNYSANFSNNRLKQKTLVDSIRVGSTDSVAQASDFSRINTQSIAQSMSFSISPHVGRITITPSLSFQDNRQFTQTDRPVRNIADSLIDRRTGHGQTTMGSVQAGVSSSTRFFGMFQPRVFGVTALRHTVTPTLSLFYNKQVYGERIPKYNLRSTFGIGNVFEMKYQKADSAQPEKIQLLNLGGTVSYDFAADSMNFSEVGLNFRTDLGRLLNVSGAASYNLYQFDPNANYGYGGRINRLLIREKGRIADLTSFSISLGTSFQAQKKQQRSETGVPDAVRQEQDKVDNQNLPSGQKKTVYSIYDREEADFSIPWNIGLSYTFSQSQQDPRHKFRTSSLNFTLSFNLTDKWQIATGGSYDFVADQHFIPSVDVTRDLHCWQMRFSWFPMGYRAGYRLEIRVKAPQLQDIKLTKQSSNRGYYY